MTARVVLIAVLLLVPFLCAQQSPRVELFAGYSGDNQSSHGFATLRFPLYGLALDADLNLNRWVGAEIGLSQHFGSATLGLQGSSLLFPCPDTTCAPQAYVAQHAAR